MSRLSRRLLADPLFWTALILGALGGFISLFQRFTHGGLQQGVRLL